MDIRITTVNLDISVALRAINAFKNGDYPAAMEALTAILDSEPMNWQARLFLAISLFRTGQIAASQRTFQYICDNSSDVYICRKAQQGLECIRTSASVKTVQAGVDVQGAYQFLDPEMRDSMGLMAQQRAGKPKPWSLYK